MAIAVEQETFIPEGLQISAQGVNQFARNGYQTLHNISLKIESGKLVAIIGASGAGKTALLETLCGLRPPAEGHIHYGGTDYYQHQAAFQNQLGYVPQDDIIHKELILIKTLKYAARLRLGATIPANQIDQTITWVLAVLGLTDRAHVKVGSLSGGERKRASIAVELLTRPQIFFLDEPTSGLDPATAADLMRVLRRLTEAGTTVVVTTHNPSDVQFCDQVVVLEKGGGLAFIGTPAKAKTFFDTNTIEEIYDKLTSTEKSWSHKFNATAPDTKPQPQTSIPLDNKPRVSAIYQWWLLTRRNAEILFHNRLTVAILVGSPIAILGMLVVLFKPHAFDPGQLSPNTTAMILFWIAFGGFFFGLTYGLLQICTELPILHRERLVALRIGPYVLSKVTVLLPILAVVDAIILAVLRALDRLPAVGWVDGSYLFITLLLSSLAALALGLLASAAVAEPSQATLALPMLCFPQVLFSGSILPVPGMTTLGQIISYPLSNRWAFEGLGHTADLEQLWQHGNSPLGPPLLAAYGDSFARPLAVNWIILSGFTVLLLLSTFLVLSLRCSNTGQSRSRSKRGAS